MLYILLFEGWLGPSTIHYMSQARHKLGFQVSQCTVCKKWLLNCHSKEHKVRKAWNSNDHIMAL
jgi:hypothetical protein